MHTATHTLDSQDDTVTILQVTDTHLFSQPDDELLGIDTQHTFNDVLTHIQKNHQRSDAVFFTGDLAQTPSNEVYQRFKTQADDLNKPYFCLAGNHDSPAMMADFFAGSGSHQIVKSEYWDFILLNSHDGTCPAGKLSPTSLDWLNSVISEDSDKHIAIFLHHHPIKVNSAWIDTHMLQDSDDFWRCLANNARIKAICFGHIHQSLATTVNNIQLYATPSTSVQFAPESTDFAVDNIASGYRWFKFFNNGTLETNVERLHYVPEKLQLHSEGY